LKTEIALDLTDLIEPSLMPTAGKRRPQPSFQDLFRQ
jgi:hypothetical protein